MLNLKAYSTQELLYIAVLAAFGLAIKPIVTPLIHLISAPLMIPGGSLAGGFYMMWTVLASIMVKRFGAAFLVGFIQAIVVLALGYFGNHGTISLISYSLPGLVIDIFSLFFVNKENPFFCVIATVLANITGTLVVVYLVMRLAFLPMIISLIAAMISGIIGGIIVFSIVKKLKKYSFIN